MSATPAQLVYVGDPMCSWCWGFAPVLERLVAAHDLPLRIVVGGLRPGATAQPLSDPMRAFLSQSWEKVAAVSGQPFDTAALQAREASWVYDTELPAIAVVAMRRTRPDDELSFFLALQEAFYADGVDITDPSVYPPLAAEFEVDGDDFAAGLADPAARREAWDDFAEAQRLGVSGFPSTLVRLDGRYRMLAAGYRAYADVATALHAALDRFAPSIAPGAACALDGDC